MYFVGQGSAGVWGYAHLTQVSIFLYLNDPHNWLNNFSMKMLYAAYTEVTSL